MPREALGRRALGRRCWAIREPEARWTVSHIHRSSTLIKTLTHVPAGRQAATALKTSQTPMTARALPLGASRLFQNATTEGMTPGIALSIQSPSSLESAHILLVGKYFEHHPWLEDPPVQAQLPFRVSCHIQSFSVWASSFLHPPPCPLP